MHVGAPHGLGTYEELRQAVHAERRRAGTYARATAAGEARPRPTDADPRAPGLVYDAGADVAQPDPARIVGPRPCVRHERPPRGLWGSVVDVVAALLP